MADISMLKQIREAIRTGDEAKAESLIASDPEQINYMTAFGTWLHVAASFGRLRLAKFLVQTSADINVSGGILEGTPLNEAASEGHLPVVEYLLSAGAVMETRDSQVNPLFSAIHGGYAEIVAMLLAKGIDAKIRYSGQSMKNMDAVAFALERGQLDIAEQIKSHVLSK